MARGMVLLSRQFRYAVYANDHPDGVLIETAAGLLGVEVGEVEHVFDVYMSPGSVTERIHFFAAPYTPLTRVTEGGGLADDGEDIEVLELRFDTALAMIEPGEIADAKTIMLLQWAALRGPFSGS